MKIMDVPVRRFLFLMVFAGLMAAVGDYLGGTVGYIIALAAVCVLANWVA